MNVADKILWVAFSLRNFLACNGKSSPIKLVKKKKKKKKKSVKQIWWYKWKLSNKCTHTCTGYFSLEIQLSLFIHLGIISQYVFFGEKSWWYVKRLNTNDTDVPGCVLSAPSNCAHKCSQC